MSITRRALLQSAAAAPSPKYNLLLITADNLGYGDLGCYGNTAIQTPEFDRFARQGARFTNFYCASPTCTASRAGLLTGRHPLRYGLNYQLRPDENKRGIGLPHGERLIPQYLKPYGYATACFGKWNLGFAPGSRPTERGFDEFFGHRSGNIDYYTHIYNGELDMFRGIEPARAAGYSVDLFADAAVDFVRRMRNRPWFVYLPFNSPHYSNRANLRPGQKLEWQAPGKYFARYGYSPAEEDEKKRYRVVVTALDDAFGRVLRALDQTGQTRRTLVFFFSDNGAFMLPARGLEVQTNQPLRDGGVTCWEGGIRVAGMARWPGRIPEQSICDELMSAMDVLPLAVRTAGGRLPASPVLDGRDPLAVLERKARSPHESLCFEFRGYQAVRSGHWKLIRVPKGAAWQLYDLERDPGERNDLAEAHPGVVARLDAVYHRWNKEVAS